MKNFLGFEIEEDLSAKENDKQYILFKCLYSSCDKCKKLVLKSHFHCNFCKKCHTVNNRYCDGCNCCVEDFNIILKKYVII